MIHQKISKLMKLGFGHIFGANIVQKMGVMLTSFVLVRILSIEEYGIWSYALNIFSFFILVQGLGSHIGVLQYTSSGNDSGQKRLYFKYGLKLNLLANVIVIAVGLILFYSVHLKIPESNHVLRLIIFALFSIGVFECYKSYFRGILQNRAYSLIITYQTVIQSALYIGLGYLMGLKGLAIGIIIANIISCFIAWIFDKSPEISPVTVKLEKKKFINFSLFSTANNVISQVLYLLDTFLIGQIMAASVAVATYKAASMIPFNLTFIPLAIMTFVYPYFCNHAQDKVYVKKKYFQLVKGLFIFNLILVGSLYFLAPHIIKILFTSRYMEAVPSFRILIVGYFFASTFRIPAGNTLAALHKVNYNMIVSIVSGITNIVLDYFLIKHYGIIGAAWATSAIYVISGILSNAYLLRYLYRD
jgi:O-antigen/teichoic acid export membrane protein